jgi:hypothetical protein
MLESFPDQLGKHMQIHELTRRKVTEASPTAGFNAGNIMKTMPGATTPAAAPAASAAPAGMAAQTSTAVKPGIASTAKAAAGGIGAVVGGLGKAVFDKALTATGMTPGDGVTSSGDAAATAGKYSQQQAQPLAIQTQKAWTQMVQAHLQAAGAAGLAQISPAENAQLKTQLSKMINDMITAGSYTSASYDTLAANIGADPSAQTSAQNATATVKKMIDDIYNSTVNPTTNNNATAMSNMFLTLAQSGILPAQHLLKFYPKSGASSNSAANSTAAPLTTGAQQLAKSLRADMASLPAAQARAQADPAAAMAQFKELMGIK